MVRRKEWIEAMEAELSQFEKLHTWDLIDPPHGTNVIPCRYVFRHKRDADGNIARYNARLVANLPKDIQVSRNSVSITLKLLLPQFAQPH